MGDLKEIRKKISSVENTRKTTKAMKLVSSSKLRRAEEMARKSRLYAEKLDQIFQDLAGKIKWRAKDINLEFFMKNRAIKTTDIIIITSDKGLCGGFNGTTIKEALRVKTARENAGGTVRLHAIGKKAISFFNFTKTPLATRENSLSSSPDYKRASAIMHGIIEDFLAHKTDEIVLIFNGFKNMLTQELQSKILLPFDFEAYAKAADPKTAPHIYVEPDDAEEDALKQVAEKFFEYSIYYALLSSLAGEHSARMQAMDAASNNASALLKTLNLSYNKARQEAITTELVEINAGAQALQ